MNELIAIDPSLVSTGLALFRGEDLVCASHLRFGAALKGENVASRCIRCARQILQWTVGNNASPTRVALEWPQVYRTAKSKGDPNGLIPLAGIASAFSGMLVALQEPQGRSVQVLSYTPNQWAGQVPKATGKASAENSPRAIRIKGRLSAKELEYWPAVSHDAIDAIGIGLYALGRFERRRSWHR